MRIVVIDGFRGFFLFFMMIIHANSILHTTFGKLNHHYFGWVEDAQGFVFMSGLVVGLVYGGRMLRHNASVMRAGIWDRIKTIYSYQLGLILIFLTAAILISHSTLDLPSILNPYAGHPILFSLLSASLVTGSTHMGILPMYIFFMIVTPFALTLLRDRKYFIYLTLIAAVWALAQTRISDVLVESLEIELLDLGYEIRLGIFFNILGWQCLFFGGLFLGFLMASKRLNTDFLFGPEMRVVFKICLALALFYGVYDRIIFDFWFGVDFSNSILSETDRGNFSVIYVATYAIDFFIVVWLLGPGEKDGNPLFRLASKLLYTLTTFKPLVFLGQHSLQVFSAHILIVYVMSAVFEGNPPSELVGILLIALSLVALYGVAWFHAVVLARRKQLKVDNAR
ncbi:hypothetical protein IWQ48_002272 [Labrenzia sp. EL_13]|nr:hypothetical protein [Labrenzia sp. EL_13]